MPLIRLVALAALALPAVALGQESYKVDPLKSAPPSGLAAPVKEALASEGLRVTDGDGKPFAEVWLRKAVPATSKPSGPKGAVQFPVLSEGELLGAVRFVVEGHDYRDQSIPPGVYTLRYGLQPINGDHLGVSPFRDYALLLPAAKDGSTAPLEKKPLEKTSAETAGASHPAVLMLLAAPANAKAPGIARDEAKNTWGAVVGLPLTVPGESSPATLPVQIIVVGAAAT